MVDKDSNTYKKRAYLARRRQLKAAGWKPGDGVMLDKHGKNAIDKKDIAKSSKDEFTKMTGVK